MRSFAKWDRAAYVDRVGGEEAAERRRRALMARRSGHRLAEERKRHGLRQAQLADVVGMSPRGVSQIERGEVSTFRSIMRSVEALGGRLDVVATFDDHTLRVTTTDGS
jgi:DNA-binding XRE family transcriptional regulator